MSACKKWLASRYCGSAGQLALEFQPLHLAGLRPDPATPPAEAHPASTAPEAPRMRARPASPPRRLALEQAMPPAHAVQTS